MFLVVFWWRWLVRRLIGRVGDLVLVLVGRAGEMSKL